MKYLFIVTNNTILIQWILHQMINRITKKMQNK